jgi:hypothetical protein
MAQVFHSFYVEGSPHAFHWIIHESVDGSGEHWRDIVRSPRTYRTWWEAHEEGGHALLHYSEGGDPGGGTGEVQAPEGPEAVRLLRGPREGVAIRFSERLSTGVGGIETPVQVSSIQWERGPYAAFPKATSFSSALRLSGVSKAQMPHFQAK